MTNSPPQSVQSAVRVSSARTGAPFLLAPGVTLAAEPIDLRYEFVGGCVYTGTGATLRQSDADPCDATTADTTATLSGVPDGATIERALLYWAGSGSPDADVTFQGQPIAGTTYTNTYSTGSASCDFFGAVADVTTWVSGHGDYTFGGLSVTTGAPHCAVSRSWASPHPVISCA